jgi:hypothetical protein
MNTQDLKLKVAELKDTIVYLRKELELIKNKNKMENKETVEEEAENSALKHFLFPKELFFKMCKCSQNYSLLEEEFGLDNTTKYREILGFIKGAKGQAERMYSEEEVEAIWKFALYSAEQHDKFGTKNKSNFITKDVKEFIEQFKKK